MNWLVWPRNTLREGLEENFRARSGVYALICATGEGGELQVKDVVTSEMCSQKSGVSLSFMRSTWLFLYVTPAHQTSCEPIGASSVYEANSVALIVGRSFAVVSRKA